ncbi:MAG: DUF21 domain-containing protein [Planctomycetes bacterium]|nr:DUF21 domain-containing protein [Planctomycetota bacterium]HPY74587.1 CNNM domain-containing protein [Planctomycetota bacterium]HQB00227.1 CNNM domain-containing protein [Planctomycetota bacterium]
MILFSLIFWIAMSAFCSGVESGIYSINPLHLRLYIEQESVWQKYAKRIAILLEDKQALICMILIYNNICNYCVSACSAQFITSLNLNCNTELISTLIITPIVFIFGETLPKNIFRNIETKIIYRLSIILYICKKLALPIIYILKSLVRFVSFLFHVQEENNEFYWNISQVTHLFSTGAKEGILTDQQKNIAKNIIQMQTESVKSTMIPLNTIGTLPPDFSKEMLLQKTKETNFTEFPVIDEKTGNILGIANFYHVFYEADDPKKLSVATCVSENSNVRDALYICTQKKQNILLVQNKEKKLVGVVTKQILFQYLLQKHRNVH